MIRLTAVARPSRRGCSVGGLLGQEPTIHRDERARDPHEEPVPIEANVRAANVARGAPVIGFGRSPCGWIARKQGFSASNLVCSVVHFVGERAGTDERHHEKRTYSNQMTARSLSKVLPSGIHRLKPWSRTGRRDADSRGKRGVESSPIASPRPPIQPPPPRFAASLAGAAAALGASADPTTRAVARALRLPRRSARDVMPAAPSGARILAPT